MPGVKFTRLSAKKIVDAVRAWIGGAPRQRHATAAPLFPASTTYLATITGSALLTGYEARWKYAHNPVKFTSDTATEAITRSSDPRAGTTADEGGYAINIRELAHIAEPGAGTAWYVWGVDAHGDDYPDGFAPRPVGGGGDSGTHKVDQVVTMHIARDASGNTIKWFDAMGSHDGTCSA